MLCDWRIKITVDRAFPTLKMKARSFSTSRYVKLSAKRRDIPEDHSLQPSVPYNAGHFLTD
jgi:hypothetical protein